MKKSRRIAWLFICFIIGLNPMRASENAPLLTFYSKDVIALYDGSTPIYYGLSLQNVEARLVSEKQVSFLEVKLKTKTQRVFYVSHKGIALAHYKALGNNINFNADIIVKPLTIRVLVVEGDDIIHDYETSLLTSFSVDPLPTLGEATLRFPLLSSIRNPSRLKVTVQWPESA